MNSEAVLGLANYEVTSIEHSGTVVRISARYLGSIACPDCQGEKLRSKGRYQRMVRHESWGMRHCWLILEAHKWLCRECGRGFRQQFPGILKWQPASEWFRRMIFFRHWDRISRRRLGQREGIGSATVERWFQHVLQRLASERTSSLCPAVLGIDEHFFSRRHGYATTFCDLKNHRVHDVVLGRSAASLEGYFHSLEGKHLVRVVCIDLATNYRALVHKHFPNALIVADRFHVIRLVNHHFLNCWRDLDPTGSKNRGLRSLMRRHRHNLRPQQFEKLTAYLRTHPALELIYRFKQRLCYPYQVTDFPCPVLAKHCVLAGFYSDVGCARASGTPARR